MRTQTHKTKHLGSWADINNETNTVTRFPVQVFVSNALAFFLGLKRVQTERQKRLGKKMLLVQRVMGAGVSPCGWNVSPGWTCLRCFVDLRLKYLFKLRMVKTSEKKTSLDWESFCAFCFKTMTVSNKKYLSWNVTRKPPTIAPGKIKNPCVSHFN